MNLARPYGPLDEATQDVGDAYFIGIDERRAPNQLEAGLGCAGKNLRFRNGKAETRKGVLICPWMKDDGRTPWAEVYGGVVFSDPNQNGDWFIIAADGGVWKTRPNMTAQPMTLPVGVTLTAATFKMFVPCTDGGTGVLVMLRGPDADPLVCVNLDAGFSAVPAHVTATRDMPRSAYGLNHLNRLLLIEGKDIVAASDILAYNEFVAIQNQYRINPGNSQALVRLLPMSNATLICFKTGSVLVVTNVSNAADGSLNGSGPDTITESYGLAGVNAVVRKGSNAYWLTNEPSVTSLRLTELNETQDTDVRLSVALSQTFGRINPLYLSGACVEVWDGKLYVALPLDDASIIGPNIVPTGQTYGGGDGYVLSGLAGGARYYYVPDTNSSEVQSQAGELLASIAPGYFIAPANGTVVLGGEGSDTISCQIYRSIPTNNAIAVYDLVTGAWCGVDEATGVFAVKAFLKTPFLGRQRLFLLGADGTIRLYEEGYEDEVFDAEDAIVVQPIETLFTSRGYQLTDGDRGRTLSASVRLRTWDPNYTLTTLNQGYNTNETAQSGVTRDRTKYDQHNRADWDVSNDNSDHANPGRQDYSVTANDPSGLNVDSAGVDCDAHQTSTDRVALSHVGDWQQISITNTRGRLELLQVKLEQQTHERRSGNSVI
jgi:hypothetical protein